MSSIRRRNASNPRVEEIAELAQRIAPVLPEMAGPKFGSADYEAAVASPLAAVSVARDRVRGRDFDLLVAELGVELSAGNYWLDRVRLARLLLEPGNVPVVYAFVERRPEHAHGTRIVRIWLARPQRLRRYLNITRKRAAVYLEDDRLAPSTSNNQQHVRRCDVAYLADWVVELGAHGAIARPVEHGRRPAKRRRVA